MQAWKQKLKNLPVKPGVYLFKNPAGEVLYVGKAKNLKSRVRSYYSKTAEFSPRINLMIEEAYDLDYVIVSSEVESLILENNFIKQYQPRYNVRLRDDKNYQFIKIDYSTEIPQIYPVRRVERKNLGGLPAGRQAKYYGPYASSSAVKQTLKLLRQIFRLCGSKKVGTRPCFYYELKLCPGVCIGKMTPKEYRQSLRSVEQFLNHKQTEVIKNLKQQMVGAAGNHEFEKAASLRDSLKSLQNIWEKQKIVSTKNVNADYFSLFLAKTKAVVHLFMIREGKLIHQENFELEGTEFNTPEMVLESFLMQYYAEASSIPQELVVPYWLPSKADIEHWLGSKLTTPKRGKKRGLLLLGEENAKDYFERAEISSESLLKNLEALLRLPHPPRRIEAYDISNIQGFLPAGSMVVFEQGTPQKSNYRKFRIKLKTTPDDVAMMKEMLTRRFAHRESGGAAWPKPDLIVIDGGKAQLNAALAVLTTYHLQLPVIGLAKRLEEIFLPHRKDSIKLPSSSPVLFLLERIRDEAHRFAITFYRKRHQKEQIRSRLDEIPRIGSVTKKKLLQTFGAISAIRNTSLEALAQAVGLAKAKKIKELL